MIKVQTEYQGPRVPSSKTYGKLKQGNKFTLCSAEPCWATPSLMHCGTIHFNIRKRKSTIKPLPFLKPVTLRLLRRYASGTESISKNVTEKPIQNKLSFPSTAILCYHRHWFFWVLEWRDPPPTQTWRRTVMTSRFKGSERIQQWSGT